MEDLISSAAFMDQEDRYTYSYRVRPLELT